MTGRDSPDRLPPPPSSPKARTITELGPGTFSNNRKTLNNAHHAQSIAGGDDDDREPANQPPYFRTAYALAYADTLEHTHTRIFEIDSRVRVRVAQVRPLANPRWDDFRSVRFGGCARACLCVCVCGFYYTENNICSPTPGRRVCVCVLAYFIRMECVCECVFRIAMQRCLFGVRVRPGYMRYLC